MYVSILAFITKNCWDTPSATLRIHSDKTDSFVLTEEFGFAN